MSPQPNGENIFRITHCNRSNLTAVFITSIQWAFARCLGKSTPVHLFGVHCLRFSSLHFSSVAFSYAAGSGKAQDTCVISTTSSMLFTGAVRRCKKRVG